MDLKPQRPPLSLECWLLVVTTTVLHAAMQNNEQYTQAKATHKCCTTESENTENYALWEML